MSRKPITLSLAQAPVTKGDIAANLSMHQTLISAASASGSDLVLFPELSLTGYELSLVGELALDQDAPVFEVLSQSAVEHRLVVIAGCPLANSNGLPYIAAVICFPDGKIEFYSKQYLHAGEAAYCAAGSQDYQLEVQGYRFTLAICADFTEPQHAERAQADAVDGYLVSALISDAGYATDAQILSGIAARHQLPVFLCNHISITGGWSACGNNSVWDQSGERVAASTNTTPSVLHCTLSDDGLSGVVSH
ncbi:Predicted amidohydrolase [Oceanospirillum multiglobuliferum]|uniref:Carbon-nitrogen hydrolase family protein n=1 Tax=Oceanospirillum multiglobuliferum TaxID=64969 RepID=A0A1T4QKC0_9GAMM|nr:carbon-nitrogen hydrolase family protein [Oceanospirillum multiglobuliferum]OPX56419.1 carbon-nitrogen hydrolase family protein [Oceanospirillum multiglobuliferum]SKA04240.1 Predicted amidohydrolase [Oceanospirillum multiglobuliferum]